MLSWTGSVEAEVRALGEKSSVMRILHRSEARRLKKRDNSVLLPAIGLQIVSAALQSSTTSEIITSALPWLSITSAVLMGVSKHMRMSERSELHTSASISFGVLYRYVSGLLARPPGARIDAEKALEYVKSQYDSAYNQCPVVSQSIVVEFMASKRFKESECIALPDVCNGLRRIHVSAADEDWA